VVHVEDAGSRFDAPLEVVWRFVSSGDGHSAAHGHRRNARERLSENSGRYSWEQEFEGSATRFTMIWTAFPPTGIAYRVIEGPFDGSVFFLYYTPEGPRTGVTIVGEFVSPTIPAERVAASALRFFAVEFEQDAAGLRRLLEAEALGGRT
jgi:hypothetical protein